MLDSSFMKRPALLLLPLLLLALRLCPAAAPLTFPTLTTTRGTTYQNVKVTRFDALEVRFTHANGVTSVPLADLPEDMQKIFGYDPRKAAAALADKHQERVKNIITEADKKAKVAAVQEQEQAELAELKSIRESAMRCFVNRVTATEESLLLEVSPVLKQPLKVQGKNGKFERYKLTPQGKPELVEQPVPGQDFPLGNTIRIVPTHARVAAGGIISVYHIGNDIGPHTLCALIPEDALRYRRQLAAIKAEEAQAPASK
jgi:hypothetical protein